MKRYITEGIEEYLGKSPVPWHMPGHKRKPLAEIEPGTIDRVLDMVQAVDVTEVPGTDDLYNPKGIIKESLNSLAEVYKTYASYYLVNGATCGILTAVTACFRGESSKKGKNKIIIGRNCHKSVYNAIELLGLEPVYIYPVSLGEQSKDMPDICGSIDIEEVRRICSETKGIGAMVLTSPTYEGVISDIKGISNVLKEHDIRLIVDEAHGAHLPFDDMSPESAIYNGADLVIHSLHKTLNALTQTAILHVINNELDEDVKKYLGIYMTSSPSYIFMYSMERAVCDGINGAYKEYNANLMKLRSRAESLKYIRIIDRASVRHAGAWDYDLSRIVITTGFNKGSLGKNKGEAELNSYISGTWLQYKLDKIGRIIVEMSGTDYVVLISTPADHSEDFDNLYRTLELLDNEIGIMTGSEEGCCYNRKIGQNERLYTKSIEKLVGTRAKDNIYVYPPGSYILTKGELITDSVAGRLIEYVEQGKEIRGRLI